MLEGFNSDILMDAARKAVRVSCTDFDDEIKDLIFAGAEDLNIAGIINIVPEEPLIKRAILTYCCMNFGKPVNYDDLKASYDEQKAQLKTATGFANWGE